MPFGSPPPPGGPPRPGRPAQILGTIGKIMLGSALLVLVMSLTILNNDSPVAPQQQVDAAVQTTSDGSVETTPDGAGGAPTTPENLVDPTLATPYRQATSQGGYVAVSAGVDPLGIYAEPSEGSKLVLSFPRQGIKQNTSTFLVIGDSIDQRGVEWYQIRIPVRPNGSTGWVRANDVTMTPLTHEIRIDLSDHRLDLYELGTKVASYPVGVGKKRTPTAVGDFYVTKISRPTDKVYGALILMISAFSDTLLNWPGGGQAGIHGTNNDPAIGTDVSSGCIRMHNRDILEMAPSTPVGTPVFIRQ